MNESVKCFIMLCTKYTEQECLGRNLMGDRKSRLQYLKEVRVGDIGFLLNTSKNELIGIFKAQSEAQLDIEAEAWCGEFGAQVRVIPIGELQRIGEAALVLAGVDIPLTPLPSGAMVPAYPVYGQEVAKKLLKCFGREA